MLLAGSLVLYRHMTYVSESGDAIKGFLGMILLQMVPLVILELKIVTNSNPVGLFCKFAAPVTLMHALFLGLRATTSLLLLGTEYFNDEGYRVVLGLIGVFIILHKGLDQSLSLRTLVDHFAVWRLALLASMAALFTEGLDCILSLAPPADWIDFMLAVAKTLGMYLELVAFVPAVWMVYQTGGPDSRRFEVDGLDAHNLRLKKMATAFFLFLVGFYILEDVLPAYELSSTVPMAAAGHIAHFLLLLDFAFYVLAHVYNPEKLVGDLKKWLPVDFSCSV